MVVLLFILPLLAGASSLLLHNGLPIPRIGVGTAAMAKRSFPQVIETAIEAGFTLFDSAEALEWYDDPLLGKILTHSTLAREDTFIITKVHPRNFGARSTQQSLNNALANYGTSYLDLVLLHFPQCWPAICTETPEGTWEDAWRVLILNLAAGKIRSIGLSNFDVPLIKRATKQFKPHVVQNWMDPFHKDKHAVDYCSKNGIVYMAYSSLGGQWSHKGISDNPVLHSKALNGIATAKNTTIVQIVLRWGIQRGVVMIPRSNQAKNVRENGSVIEHLPLLKDSCADESNTYWLSQTEMEEINRLPEL